MNKNPLTPVPSERLLGPGYGQGVWPLRERLALATALLDVDNQQGSWAATSRRMMCFSRPGRPPTWCSSKACAKQYALLLDSIELVKRQKIPGCDTQTSQLSLAERVVKRLSAERAEELRSRIRLGQLYYTSLKNIISEVESGIYDSQLMDLLSVINPITDCKKKSENLDGESIQTTVLVNDDTSEQQTIVANDTTNASQSNDCNKYSDKSTAESGSFDNNQSCTESFIGLWKEIQGFYHIPDSTWYCAPGPINNRISTSAYGGVTSRSRQSAGVSSLNFSRLSTLLAEASSPSLKPATEFRNSTNKSSSYKPSLHDTSHTTAASRAAEAAKQRYLSKKGKNKFSSRKSQLDRNYKTMKQDNKLKNWSKNISRNSLYDCTATSSPSKADHIKRATNRKSQLSDSRSSCISVYKKSVFEREELSDYETDLDNDDSMYEESSTDKQTDTPSSTPSTIAMCISDVEDFLIQDDEKSDKTIPNDDSTTYSTLDNDRPAATIPEDETNDYNSESEKSVSSNAVSSLSTEAVRETDSRVGDRNSSVCSSPTLENITDGPEIAVEEELRLDNVNQKSPVDDIVASSNMNLSAYGILDVANDNPENGMELRTITDIHCSPVLSVDIQVPVENLCSVGSADFVDTDSKMSHSVTYISNIGKSPNVTLSASDVEKVLDKKVDLSSNSAAQAKKVNNNTDMSNTPVLNLNSPVYPCNESSQLNNSPSPNPKISGLRLRLCRQGSQLIVIPPSDPYNSSQVINTSSKELALINDCSDNSWFSWANQLLSDGERIVGIKLSSDESVILSPRFRSHTSSNLKELVHELLDPVINNLNNGSITSKIQFIHKLLSVLAHAAMTRVSNTIRNRIAMELYRHWSQQLQVNVSEPNFSSTPYCYNSKTPPFVSMETEDSLLNTCIDPPTLILASSSFNLSSSNTSVDTTKSIPPLVLEAHDTNPAVESGRGKQNHSSIEDINDDSVA